MSEQRTLPPLPYPVFFVCKNNRVWGDIMNEKVPPPVEKVYERFLDGRDVWSVQTYIQLKKQGLEVYLVPHVVPGKICIITNDDLNIKDCPFNSYVVACRHDRGRPEICEQRIVQNQLSIVDCTDHYLLHWPQPNLQPRDPLRGTKIENIAFKGLSLCLAERFQSPKFLEQLRSIGVSLSISPADLNARFGDWTNYTQADLVLAVRDCTDYVLSIKPPSKLINAWFAGCPALLGLEPAYQHLRQSELDYIEVREPDDVIKAVNHLRNNSALYCAMVENGFRRAENFTPDKIVVLWRNLLAGPIAEGYEKWLQQSPMWKLIGRPAQFAYRSIRHKQEKRLFFQNINY